MPFVLTMQWVRFKTLTGIDTLKTVSYASVKVSVSESSNAVLALGKGFRLPARPPHQQASGQATAPFPYNTLKVWIHATTITTIHLLNNWGSGTDDPCRFGFFI